MNEFYNAMEAAFFKAEIAATKEQIEQCSRYGAFLVEKNKVMNLTGITDPVDVAVKHFCDSLMLLKYYNFPQGASIIDIGTGAGFPGLPLAILRPDMAVTLLDSLEKRCHFLKEVVASLDLFNVTVIWRRAEEGARDQGLRAAFDFATARAVAGLPILIEYAIPYLKVGGHFLPLKGKSEDSDCSKALEELKASITREYCYHLPIAEEERRIYAIKKTADTPDKYPRRTGKPSKKPL